MPHIPQNRSRWLMGHEYGATVNAPSKKGSANGWSPLFAENSGRFAVAIAPGDRLRSAVR